MYVFMHVYTFTNMRSDIRRHLFGVLFEYKVLHGMHKQLLSCTIAGLIIANCLRYVICSLMRNTALQQLLYRNTWQTPRLYILCSSVYFQIVLTQTCFLPLLIHDKHTSGRFTCTREGRIELIFALCAFRQVVCNFL